MRSSPPLGWHLAQVDKELKALDLSYAQGTRWTCDHDTQGKLDCRVYGITPSAKVEALPGLSTSVRLFPQASEEGFHGVLYVGALSASLPATLPPSASQLPGTLLRRPGDMDTDPMGSRHHDLKAPVR